MIRTSVICFLSSKANVNRNSLLAQIAKSRDLVTTGRYLICVFEIPNHWNSRVPIEALVINSTMGDIHNRSLDWEFFGNGVIRCYTSKSLRYKKTLQWTVVRRVGDKPYTRKNAFPSKELDKNRLPVSHKVFTRDVANNVWHLKFENLKERIVARFSALLVWQDEEFVIVDGSRLESSKDRRRLDLDKDLVGVPKKIEYLWDNGELLF